MQADRYLELVRRFPLRTLRSDADFDRIVDQCYRRAKFESDSERVEFLFQLYEKRIVPLTVGLKQSKRRGGKRT